MATSNRCVLRWCFALVSAAMLVTGEVRGQCEVGWLPSQGVAGANGAVRQFVRWDPDGAGPLATRILMEGDFVAVADVASSRLAWLDTGTGEWGSFGDALGSGRINAVAVLPNNQLILGGSFWLRDRLVRQLIRWDGTQWVEMPRFPFIGDVLNVLGLPDGSLVVLEGTDVNGQVSRLDGTTRTPLGGELSMVGPVAAERFSLHVDSDGSIILSGTFNAIGDTPVSGIARWNGSNWQPLGGGLLASEAGQLARVAQLSDGSLVVAGRFTQVGGVPTGSFARWDGRAWAAMDSAFRFDVTSIWQSDNGAIIASGTVPSTNPWVPASQRVVRWDGQSWSVIHGMIDSDRVGGVLSAAATLPNGDLLVGGRFANIGATNALNLGVRNASGEWRAMGEGLWADVWGVAELPTGELLVGTIRWESPTLGRSVVMRQTSNGWAQVGDALRGGGKGIAVLPSGRVVVFGSGLIDTIAMRSSIVELVDGRWQALGSQLTGFIETVAELPNGDIVIGGSSFALPNSPTNHVVRWDGTGWRSLGAGLNAIVRTLRVLPNGDLLAGGGFTASGETPLASIARWDGTQWLSMGAPGMPVVWSILPLPDGEYLACGSPASSGPVSTGFARFDGSAWQRIALPTWGEPTGLALDAGGSIFVTGRPMQMSRAFGYDVAMLRVGDSWVRPGNGLRQDVVPNFCARADVLLPLRDGTLAVGGKFGVAGTNAAGFLAFWGLPPNCRCDSLDFNNDGFSPSDEDLVDLLAVLAGGACSTPACNDIDFNNDGLFPSDEDLLAFLRVLGGGPCAL